MKARNLMLTGLAALALVAGCNSNKKKITSNKTINYSTGMMGVPVIVEGSITKYGDSNFGIHQDGYLSVILRSTVDSTYFTQATTHKLENNQMFTEAKTLLEYAKLKGLEVKVGGSNLSHILPSKTGDDRYGIEIPDSLRFKKGVPTYNKVDGVGVFIIRFENNAGDDMDLLTIDLDKNEISGKSFRQQSPLGRSH